MKGIQKNLLLLFYILAGVVFGAMLANVCRDVSFLSWLSYHQSIGFSADAPLRLDLGVVQITFGFSMGVSVAQIFTIALALFLYNKTRIR